MRVTINHREETRGMLKKKTFCAVEVAVQFSEEEKQIIDMWDLGAYVILERLTPADQDGDIHDGSPLTLDLLLMGTSSYVAGTPLAAKNYHEEVKNGLETLKGFIMANADIENKHETFEL